MWSRLPSLPTMAIGLALAAAVVAAGALAVAGSGILTVAASHGHWAVTNRFLEFTMRSSVRTHALSVAAAPRLDDPDLLRLGAGHFAGGCAPCHGAPGTARGPIYLRMLPPPTDLADAVSTWTPRQLFWIVKNGIKYSGMPAWVTLRRDDEVWAVVAFLRALPQLTPDQYRNLAAATADEAGQPALELVRHGIPRRALTACARCHGDERSSPHSRLVPRLAGQDRAYLSRALREYAQGRRPSGIMQPVAAALDSDDVSQLGAYYAGLPARAIAPSRTEAKLLEAGRRIATEGAAQQSIPACIACHRDRVGALIPRLDGQPAPYLAGQLRLWRAGGRTGSVESRIMAAIALRLDDHQIDAVAAYFESILPLRTNAVGLSGAAGVDR